MQKKSWFKGVLNENKKGRHAEFISASHLVSVFKSGEILNQVQDDTVFYNGVKAFTLIELLVVVLIIGILAAVALPRYQLAVTKARVMQLVTIAESVRKAQERYYLANNKYTNDFDELDLSFEGTLSTDHKKTTSKQGWYVWLATKEGGSWGNLVSVQDPRFSGIFIRAAYNYGNSSWWNGRMVCVASTSNTKANKLCQQLTKQKANQGVDDGGGYYNYTFN